MRMLICQELHVCGNKWDIDDDITGTSTFRIYCGRHGGISMLSGNTKIHQDPYHITYIQRGMIYWCSSMKYNV